MTPLFEIEYDIFYLIMCAGHSTKPLTGLSYSRAPYMCETHICQFQKCWSQRATT
jgi:hypothetical protein